MQMNAHMTEIADIPDAGYHYQCLCGTRGSTQPYNTAPIPFLPLVGFLFTFTSAGCASTVWILGVMHVNTAKASLRSLMASGIRASTHCEYRLPLCGRD